MLDNLTLIPLFAFTLAALMFMGLAIDSFVDRGLSLSSLARFCLELALSSLLLLPVAYVLLDASGEWYIFIGITALLLIAALCALLGQLARLISPRR
ncbi:MAG: hypothetical protein IMW90_18655 [Thermogemmatispora sp.]|jgi:hypothetical protein|uniref:hypothetical protein n=1 Tax=Thermogemmatispora TaxID=768669 RepID=UPI00124CFE8D|nr:MULTISPECIES: hypothetical protein [Thermogemmatispora]MBE3567742.1 hypothetical protein [Thermogemmatispora sp.]GER85470.1 hypothetical protein KTAU_41050 [Thermogemmatispora aurantia]